MEQVSSNNRLIGMELDLRAYARVLYKRKWIAAASLVVCVAVGVVLTARTTPIYQTRTTVFVGERQFTIERVQRELAVRYLSVGLLKSYVEIVKSRTIAQKAIVDSGLDETPQSVQGGLWANVVVDTQVIEVHYAGPDPARATRIANAVAEAFVNEIGRLAVTDEEGEPAVEVSIIDRAIIPGAPISPNSTRNIVLAVLIGLLGGVGLAFLVEYLDVTVKQREEIEALGLPSLGSIPRLDTHGQDVYVEKDTQGLGGEAFRKLRTSIGFINLERPTRSILVTSPVSQEGKTTTALNLAVAYALGGLRTVLVEADLRRPSLHRAYGMSGTNGLTTAIVGEVPLTEAIMQTETRNLSVIVAGAIPPNPVELLGSDQMTDVLERLERMFDVVVVDSPPIAPVADPATLAGRCGGVVLVVRAGKTDRRRIVDSARVIERAGGHLLGVVLNFQKPGDTPYEYEYYYGYRPARPNSVTAGDVS
jgi:receptor protein-tyrosine kinase